LKRRFVFQGAGHIRIITPQGLHNLRGVTFSLSSCNHRTIQD